MINGILPQDLSQTLVFESNGVARLQQRIKELEHEKQLQKKQMKSVFKDCNSSLRILNKYVDWQYSSH